MGQGLSGSLSQGLSPEPADTSTSAPRQDQGGCTHQTGEDTEPQWIITCTHEGLYFL